VTTEASREGGWWGIVNPGAGNRNDALERAKRALAWRKIEAHLHLSRTQDHLRDLVSEGVGKGYGQFLAVGGDGTINLVVTSLLSTTWPSPPTLGVLPAGSGSDLIRTFGISQNLDEAANHLLGDRVAPLDAVLIRGEWGERYFVNSAGSGLTAAVVEQVNRLPPRLGAFRYQIGIWPALLRHPHALVDVACGATRFEGKALMVVISNARFLGGGMRMAPHAEPADGEVDIQVFTGPKRLALTLKPMVQRGRHLNHPNVTLMKGSEFTVATDPAWPVEADGEFLGRGMVQGSVKFRALMLKV